MLSYRHQFHAGNYADVLKHSVLVLLLQKLAQKDKPFVYFDTHSGAGLYDTLAEEAQKTGEFAQGFAQLWPERSQFPELSPFFDALAAVNPDGDYRFYPGSPKIAAHLMRKQDRLLLMELHPNESGILKRNFLQDDRVAIHHRDGFEALVALTPPQPARGLALIDPAYEVKTDYQQVIDSVEKALKRWPVGIYALWFPLLSAQRDQSDFLKRRLADFRVKNILLAELTVAAQQAEHGMHGSAIAIINAPWQLDEQLATLLPKLWQTLSPLGQGYQRVDWLIEE